MSHKVGKPSLADVIGTGICQKISIPCASQVRYADRARKGISRDMDQENAGKVEKDTGTLNKRWDK